MTFDLYTPAWLDPHSGRLEHDDRNVLHALQERMPHCVCCYGCRWAICSVAPAADDDACLEHVDD